MIATHPALWLLARRKFRGVFRKQVRRVKSVKGALFAFFGLLVFAIWIASILLPSFFSKTGRRSGEIVEITTDMAQVGIFTMVCFTMIASVGYRGLFLPKDEIEFLFSSPISRRDVIRYRLLTNIGRSIFGGLVIGLFAMQKAPNGLYAFLGSFFAVQTLPLLSQGVSLLVGGAENRFSSRIPKRVAQVGGIFAAFAYIAILMLLATNSQTRVSKWMDNTDVGRLFADVIHHPVLWWASSVCRPWALMITAKTLGEFLPWLVVSTGVWIALFELVSRIPVDYRELSLQTAADVAKRIQRMRRAGGASASQVSKRAAGWTVPWFFGRGRFGAIAWLKTVSIVRKARGTLLVSLAIVAFITAGATAIGMSKKGSNPAAEVGSSIGVAIIGCLYLCGGLRFDFREDLDRMEFVKTCPARPWVIFLANVTPQVVLVSGLVVLSLIVKSAIVGRFDPSLWLLIPAVPLLTLTWVAIDNIVFLAAPVRYVAGQDTVLQNAGRTMVMMMVRLTIMVAVFAALAVPIGLAALTATLEPAFATAAITIGIAMAFVLWIFACAVLVAAGAWQLRRFDVSRDRA